MQQSTIEVDFNRSEIFIIDKTDRPEAMGTKTLSRIDIKIWLRFVTPQDTLVSKIDAGLFRRRRFRKSEKLGDWIQSTRNISTVTNKKGLPLTAHRKSEYYMFKWAVNLPEEFKYEWLDSRCFVKLTSSFTGQRDYKKDFDIQWTGLRTGRLKKKNSN